MGNVPRDRRFGPASPRISERKREEADASAQSSVRGRRRPELTVVARTLSEACPGVNPTPFPDKKRPPKIVRAGKGAAWGRGGTLLGHEIGGRPRILSPYGREGMSRVRPGPSWRDDISPRPGRQDGRRFGLIKKTPSEDVVIAHDSGPRVRRRRPRSLIGRDSTMKLDLAGSRTPSPVSRRGGSESVGARLQGIRIARVASLTGIRSQRSSLCGRFPLRCERPDGGGPRSTSWGYTRRPRCG